jgi:hypothetical protein
MSNESTAPRGIGNAIATLRISLDIPEDVIHSLAKANGLDPSSDDDYEAVCQLLESEIEDSPSDYSQYERSTEVEVTA